MSFWAGLARGFQDADAKKEREATRAEAEAARKEGLAYGRDRDKIMDERYVSEQKTAADLRLAENRKWKLNYDASQENLKANREWREAEALRAQSNIEVEWERKDVYDDKTWALTMDKWDFTQDQAKEAKIHADKVFDQTIKAFEYGKDQDVITNLRRDKAETRELANTIYQKERDLVGDARAKENRDDRLKSFEFQVKRAGVSDDQWQQSFDMRVEDQKIARTSSLLAMLPPGMAASLGGDTKTNTKRAAVSKDALTAAGSKFQAKFNTLSDKAKESEFFKAAAGDLKVQATLLGFMEAQAEKNNNIKMEDLPKYFDYLGKTEGRGQAKAKEMLEAIMSGDENVNDADSFIKGMLAFKNVKESKALFMQKGAPVELKDQNDQIKYWETSIVTDAYAGMDGLSPEDRETVSTALSNVELDDGLKIQGLRTLAKFKFGKDAIAEHNMDVGYINKMYPAEVEAEEPIIPTNAELALLNQEPKMKTKATVVSSMDEFNTLVANGHSTPISLNGKIFYPPGSTAESTPTVDTTEKAEDSWLWREGNEKEKAEDSWLWREGNGEDTTSSFEGSKLVKGDGESSADYQDRINPEVDIEDELEKEFGNASESDEMLNGETETSDLPDDETMRKYNADIEAIVKQLPQDASEEDKISMVIGAFMKHNPELDPKLSEDDLEFLITSAIQ